MIVVDRHIDLKTTGNFLTLCGIADLHLLCEIDKAEKREHERKGRAIFDPLNKEAWHYLHHCMAEVVGMPKYYGKVMTFLGGDTTELERSSIRKAKRQAYHKNDSRAEDQMYKYAMREYVIPRVKTFVKGTDFIGGVAGNHLIDFSDESLHRNSEEYIIKTLGGVYGGEAMLLLNLHISYGSKRRLIKVVIQHGTKGGTKTSIIRELQAMYGMFGEVHCLIKCHAHDPMTAFYAKYNPPTSQDIKHIGKTETLVMCLGATRDGMKIGYDDYSERCNYAPTADRYPMAIFHAYRDNLTQGLNIKIRPLTM